jgi:hypothetical protein
MSKAGSIEKSKYCYFALRGRCSRLETYLPEDCGRDGQGRLASVNLATLRISGYDSSLPHNDRRSNPFKSLSVGK